MASREIEFFNPLIKIVDNLFKIFKNQANFLPQMQTSKFPPFKSRPPG